MPKISDPVYPSQTGAQVANGDLMYIVDVGTPNISEKITVNELAQAPQFSSRYAPLPGAWTAYTPTVTAGNGTITTLGTCTGRYVQLGKLVIGTFDLAVTTKGTAAGAVQFTLPVNCNTTNAVTGTYREVLSDGASGAIGNIAANIGYLTKTNNATAFTTDNLRFIGTFMYEAA